VHVADFHQIEYFRPRKLRGSNSALLVFSFGMRALLLVDLKPLLDGPS
jgi:hypothetical protein